jgi:hypothetical protein
MHRRNREREENLKLECGWCVHCRGANIITLNWLRLGSSKQSGRDEPIWVVIHKCMETTLGISLYSYLYLKLAKCYVFLIVSYVFLSTKSENNKAEQVLPRSRGGGEEMAQKCIHM